MGFVSPPGSPGMCVLTHLGRLVLPIFLLCSFCIGASSARNESRNADRGLLNLAFAGSGDPKALSNRRSRKVPRINRKKNPTQAYHSKLDQLPGYENDQGEDPDGR